MTKRLLGGIALGVGLALVPFTVRSTNDSKVPTLAVSEACAQTGECCPSNGDFCVSGGRVYANMRPSNGQPCKKPGT